MAIGWFSKRGKPVPAVPASPAALPEVMPMPAPVADLDPEPAIPLPTELAPPPATPPAATDIPLDKIAALAYEIWVEKGRPLGTDRENWLQAEHELRTKYAANRPPEPPPQKPR